MIKKKKNPPQTQSVSSFISIQMLNRNVDAWCQCWQVDMMSDAPRLKIKLKNFHISSSNKTEDFRLPVKMERSCPSFSLTYLHLSHDVSVLFIVSFWIFSVSQTVKFPKVGSPTAEL